MFGKRSASLLSVGLLCAVAGVYLVAADKETTHQRRDRLNKVEREGNYKVAYEGLRRLALDPSNDPLRVGDDHLDVVGGRARAPGRHARILPRSPGSACLRAQVAPAARGMGSIPLIYS